MFDQLAPLAPSTGVMALAERPSVDPPRCWPTGAPAPVVLLEDPRDLGNMGACVRVAAAADAAGVLSTGSHDPWHPDALRGAAGLHFARAGRPPAAAGAAPRSATGRCSRSTPRAIRSSPPSCRRARCSPSAPSATASAASCSRSADARVSIPMRAGVSSLNLATSVAAVLFAWRLSARPVSPLP